MKYIVKKKIWNKKVKRRLKYKKVRRKKLGEYLLKAIEISLIVAVLVFSGSKIYNFVFYSSYFQIKKVRVEGLMTFPQQQILRVAGFPSPENIFHINLKKLKSMIQKHPSIRKVKISRRLPDTLLITIKERMPMALVRRNQQLYGFDQQGIIFKLPLEASEIRLPVITGLEDKVISGKGKNTTRLITAVRLLNEFLNAGLPIADEILEVDLTEIEYVILQTKNYGVIRLGRIDFENFRKNLIRLATILESIKKQEINVEYIDMRFKNTVIKPVG